MRRWLFRWNPSCNVVTRIIPQLRRKATTTRSSSSTTSTPTSHSSPAVSVTRKANINIPHISAQRCIREIMVRQLLLSSQPLTIRGLVDLVHGEYIKARDSCGNSTLHDTWSNMTSTVSSQIAYLHDFLLSSAKTEKESTISHKGKNNISPVEGTVRLILALDPQFRVSSAGYVCYPNLPSLLVPTMNIDHNEAWVRTTRKLVRMEESKHGDSAVDVAANKKEHVLSSRWSYMLSLWYLLDSVMESEDDTASKETNRILSTSTTGNGEYISLSKLLVDLWVKAFDARDLPVLLRSDSTSSSASTGNTTGTETKCHIPLELHACDEGNDHLRRWYAEAKEGYVSSALLGAPLLNQSTSTLLQFVNDQVGYLFTLIIATPITVGRLAGLIQWASLPFAAHYRSLLHFLLIYTGNPAVVRMEQHELRRRETQRRWVELLRAKRIRYEDHRVRQRNSRSQVVDRRILTGRYASQECVEEDVKDAKESSSSSSLFNVSDMNSHNNTANEGTGTTREVSSEQYGWWWRSSDGPSVNPRFSDVCRCIFMQPHEMIPLDLSKRTPSEIMEYFDETDKENTANSIVVFSAAPYVFERRICRIMRSWWILEGQYTVKEKSHAISISSSFGSDKTVIITIRRLCQLCLWEHEYGTVPACNMMLHYLKLVTRGENIIELIPPSTSTGKTTQSSTEGGDAGNWLVLLRTTREESSTKTLEGGI
ncbi:hypothetical protein LSM04_005449 [Trypanosoma melophagium]|uniref:uncharacterized protein n=1 Tax=Trypanosoma melophagium TaxID=715481 RepID=UPI003519DCF3|nr:hypothetical protein LSM04_005449 [Trypanosoma melophagium]